MVVILVSLANVADTDPITNVSRVSKWAEYLLMYLFLLKLLEDPLLNFTPSPNTDAPYYPSPSPLSLRPSPYNQEHR